MLENVYSMVKTAKKYGLGGTSGASFQRRLQLFPVINEGAIQGYSRMSDKSPQTPTTRMTQAQLLSQHGNYLFTHVRSETVFTLDKN
jgi:hypothetical protein